MHQKLYLTLLFIFLLSCLGFAQSALTIDTQKNNNLNHRQQKSNDPPLTPSNGGRSIVGGSLHVGDLIFTSVDNTKSKLIRKFTGGGPASHVAAVSDITAGIVFIIEAISSGVRKIPLDDFLRENSNVVAFRYPSISSSQVQLFSAYLNDRVGAKYDYFGAGVATFFKLNDLDVQVDYGEFKTKRTFCSRLMIEGFLQANISVCSLTGGWGTPNDLATLTWTDQLQYVGHLKYTP